MAYTPVNLADLIKVTSAGAGASKFILPRLMLWPLIMACSVKVKFKGSSFIPEYIISQLLLQYVREDEDIDGIRYFSMHFDAPVNSIPIASNFVFPSKTNASNGYCSKLRNKFYITEPLSWQLGKASAMNQDYSGVYQGAIPIIAGLPTQYQSTDFAEIESKLNCIKAVKI